MTTQTVEAIFQNGTFCPISKIPVIAEGQQVRLVVEVEEVEPDVLTLVGAVFEGLSEEEISDVERIALDRGHFSRI